MAITNKTIVDNTLTSEQSAKIGLETLTNKVEDLGGVYNSSARKNTSLKDNFSGYNRTIVNAINSLDDKNATTETSILNLVSLLNNTIGDVQTTDIDEANKKLQALFGDKPIITGLLDYYCDGLGFKSSNFKGKYSEIPYTEILNRGDVIQDDDTGVYYTLLLDVSLNNSGVKYTIDELASMDAIDKQKVTNPGDTNLYGILYKGEYEAGVEYEPNDLITNGDSFYLVIERGIAPADFESFNDNVKMIGGGSGSGSGTTLPSITYEVI